MSAEAKPKAGDGATSSATTGSEGIPGWLRVLITSGMVTVLGLNFGLWRSLESRIIQQNERNRSLAQQDVALDRRLREIQEGQNRLADRFRVVENTLTRVEAQVDDLRKK